MFQTSQVPNKYSSQKFQFKYNITNNPIMNTSMNIQNRSLSHKSQPKSLNPPRNSQPVRHDTQVSLKERPFLNNVKQLNITQEGAIASAKVRLQRPQEYLIRKETTIKECENQVEKLTQICQEFFRENQRLKEKIREKDEASQQMWKRMTYLQSQLHKPKQKSQPSNYQSTQITGHRRSMPSQHNPNNYHSEPQGHRIIITSGQQQNNNSISPSNNNNNNNMSNDSIKIEKLMKQLKNRQEQLMKYMHKEAQFIEIYVEKERLEQQARTLQNVITSQNKQLDEFRRNYKRNQDKWRMDQSAKMEEDSIILEKSKQYNEKLLEMLEFSSKEIQRLNHILKVKMGELEKTKGLVEEQQREISQLRKIKIETRSKSYQPQLHSFKKLNIQTEEIKQSKLDNEAIKNLQKENGDLRKRLQDQVAMSFELRKLVQNLEAQCKAKLIPQNQAETQTDNGVKQEEKKLQQKINTKTNETEQFVSDTIEKALITPLSKQQKKQTDPKIEALEQRAKSLREQNTELTKFIMQQNNQTIKLKDQIKQLNERNRKLQERIAQLGAKEKQLPLLMDKVLFVQQKLNQVTNEYERLLNEAQSSYGETESVQRQIQHILQQRGQQLSVENFQYEPIKTRSQANYKPKTKIAKIKIKQNDGFQTLQHRETSIRMDKDYKTQSQSQFHLPKDS